MFGIHITHKKERKFYHLVKNVGTGLQVFGEKIYIQYPEKISIGNNLKINDNVTLNARGGITIGDNVTLSAGCSLITSGYNLDIWKTENERTHKNAPITIGNNVWVYTNAIICPGVNISGEHVVVAAGAVVTKSITESNCIVAGIPAQIKKKI